LASGLGAAPARYFSVRFIDTLDLIDKMPQATILRLDDCGSSLFFPMHIRQDHRNINDVATPQQRTEDR
jgi:hypothetical protein